MVLASKINFILKPYKDIAYVNKIQNKHHSVQKKGYSNDKIRIETKKNYRAR